MREIKFYDIIRVWNIDASFAILRAIIKKPLLITKDLVATVLLKIRGANTVGVCWLKGRQANREDFATINATLYGEPKTYWEKKHPLIKMGVAMKGNYLELPCDTRSGEKPYSSEIITLAKYVEITGGVI